MAHGRWSSYVSHVFRRVATTLPSSPTPPPCTHRLPRPGSEPSLTPSLHAQAGGGLPGPGRPGTSRPGARPCGRGLRASTPGGSTLERRPTLAPLPAPTPAQPRTHVHVCACMLVCAHACLCVGVCMCLVIVVSGTCDVGLSADSTCPCTPRGQRAASPPSPRTVPSVLTKFSFNKVQMQMWQCSMSINFTDQNPAPAIWEV